MWEKTVGRREGRPVNKYSSGLCAFEKSLFLFDVAGIIPT
jgi:hypothetical protein